MSARSRSQSPGGTGARERSRSPRGDDGELESLMTLMNDREASRKRKDWVGADAIRDQLREKGVQIFDKMGIWITKDGRKWQIGDGVTGAPSLAPSSYGSIQSNPSAAITGDTALKEITDLIDEREFARQRKDFDEADKLRQRIKDLGATIFDKEKVWKTSDGKLGLIPDWGPPGAGGQLPQLQPQAKLAEQTIVLLVDEREEARAAKDWNRADQIRDLLKSKGVQIFDKEGVWRSNSSQGVVIPLNQKHAMMQMQAGGMGGMMGGMGGMGQNQAFGAYGGMSNDYKQQQQSQTDAMKAYWASMGMGGMAGMGGQMGQQMNQQMNQQMGQMGQMGGMGAMGGMGGMGGMAGMGDDVEAIIRQREMSRHAKDFATADQLRDRLRTLGVTLHEKEKRWDSADGRSGVIPPFSSLMQ